MVRASWTSRGSLLLISRTPGASLERFGEELREIFELKVRTPPSAKMSCSGQDPACAGLGSVGKCRLASCGSNGTGAGDRVAVWWRLGRLKGEEVAGGVQSEGERENDAGEREKQG
ncbi:hypothetical protein L3X38_033363 [Prunus dulcis]|uniref:Uncharacterized protein n=1 Tax=Prunus dulcis TaxID=3755 RepID=A0AAD4VFT3_PRUDU|nr:hypothetical protein L3X38_033363 [Prunus dulcis]